MNPRNVWPAVVLALGGLGGIGVMEIFKVNNDVIVTIAFPLITMVLGALLAAQGATTQATVQAVQQQTNGHQLALVQLIRDQSEQLAQQAKLLATMHPPLTATPPPTVVPPASEGASAGGATP